MLSFIKTLCDEWILSPPTVDECQQSVCVTTHSADDILWRHSLSHPLTFSSSISYPSRQLYSVLLGQAW